MDSFDARNVVSLLNSRFLNSYNTVLVGGFEEPFYKAFYHQQPAEIQYTQDYFRSALHELAHWCVAGRQRRDQDDYGYWYAADGRNQQQQDEFFQVEVRPQTIEWAFSIVSGVQFEVSVDNLTADVNGVDEFKNGVSKLMSEFMCNGFPSRVDEILKLISSYQDIGNYKQYIENFLNL